MVAEPFYLRPKEEEFARAVGEEPPAPKRRPAGRVLPIKSDDEGSDAGSDSGVSGNGTSATSSSDEAPGINDESDSNQSEINKEANSEDVRASARGEEEDDNSGDVRSSPSEDARRFSKSRKHARPLRGETSPSEGHNESSSCSSDSDSDGSVAGARALRGTTTVIPPALARLVAERQAKGEATATVRTDTTAIATSTPAHAPPISAGGSAEPVPLGVVDTSTSGRKRGGKRRSVPRPPPRGRGAMTPLFKVVCTISDYIFAICCSNVPCSPRA